MENDKELVSMTIMCKPVKKAIVITEANAEQLNRNKRNSKAKERIMRNSEMIKRHATFSYRKQG